MDWRTCERCGVPREWTFKVCDEVVCHECSSAYEDREPFLELWDSVAESDGGDDEDYENFVNSFVDMEDLDDDPRRRSN